MMRPNLRERIFETLVRSDFHERSRQFSPEGSLDGLLTEDSIAWAFCKRREKPPETLSQPMRDMVNFIVAGGKKLLAICILTGFKDEQLQQVMELFRVNDISDNNLPVHESVLEGLRLPSLESSTGAGYNDQYDEDPPWDKLDRHNFWTQQWQFCAPVFSAQTFNHNLDVDTILPFIEKSKSPADKGAFGRVFRCRVHESHLCIESPLLEYVAIKEIDLVKEQGPDKGQDRMNRIHSWEKEARALWEMNFLNQKHIVKFITAFRRGDDDYYLMLEWADGGNLRNLWKNFPRPTLTGDLVKATFEQLLGLARAISEAHTPGGSQAGGFYRHGDLKPENILWFKDGGTFGTLKIGDWGLAKQHQIVTDLRTKQTTTEYGTRRYEPPEEETGESVSLTVPNSSGKDAKRRSRLYDIWAMGCIALEFLIWLMYGLDGLARFNRSVREGLMDSVPFYEILMEDGKVVAKVHRVVVKWMDHMAQDPVCEIGSTALGNLLELIRDKLLVVNLPTGLGSSIDMSLIHSERNANSSNRANTNSKVVVDPLNSAPGTTGAPTIILTEPGQVGTSVYGETELDPAPKPPRSARGGRARAKDFLDRMEEISGEDEVESYWLIGTPKPPPTKDINDLPIRVQEDIRHQTADSRRGGGQKQPEQAPIGQLLTAPNADGAPTERKDYGKTNLEDKWNYIIDNDCANRVLSAIKNKSLPAHAVSPTSNLCSTCRTFRDELWEPRFSISYDLSHLEKNSRDNTCDLCVLLWRACKQGNTAKADQVSFEREGSTLVKNGYGPAVASIFRNPDLRTGIDQQIQVGLPCLPKAGSDAYLEVIRQWLEICDHNHSKTCVQDPSLSSSGSLGATKKLPTRVIAVGHKNDDKVHLVETRSRQGERGEWIALSHQWGAGPQFCTNRANLQDHIRGIDMKSLPATFRDAVIVTRALGCSYLWIDSLCIIQGRDGDFSQEAKRMEQVYSGAYCVLAASRSPGHFAGFLGARTERLSFGMQRERDSAPFFISETIDDFDAHVLDGPLSKRGWVLQEHALARRTVYFTEHQTYFECGDGVRCETMTKMTNKVAAFLGDPSFPKTMMRADKGEKILGYQDLYKRYCRLGLSHDTDRPWAINGLQERILTALKIEGGLGVFYEDQENGRRRGLLRRSLLWRRADDVDGLSRIQFSEDPAGPFATNIPSWSWMAYTGGIDYIPADFGGMDWEPIQTQWDPEPKKTSYGILIAEARDYRTNDADAFTVLDSPPVLEQLTLKCVVLGKEKRAVSDDYKKNYVLLIQAKPDSHGGRQVYQRVGVGILPGKCVEPNGEKVGIH